MKCVLLGLALLASAFPDSWAATPTPPLKISGIYTDLAFNSEGGDLLGTELMIVPRQSKGDPAWSVFVQISEGGTPYMALIPLTLNGNKIEFNLPPGTSYGGMHFTGTISSIGIRLDTPSGQVEVLRRGKSYWQEPHAVDAGPADTSDARTQAATRYIDKYDLQSRIDAMVTRIMDKHKLTSEERQRVQAQIRKHLRVNVLREVEITSMANSFTTQEINALTAFIETGEGQSIMSKYGSYLAAVMPVVTAEFERALNEIKAELNEK